MKETETIRDFYGRILGYIITDTVTGDAEARDFYQRILGFYKKDLNQTRDFYKRIIGKGNLLASLITQANDKK